MVAEDKFENNESSYARTLRHDAPMWQSLQREWLYHSSHLSNRREAGTEFAVMYLRTFYWYGWYQRSSLCDGLLADWNLSTDGNEDREWLELLQDFGASYPTVWEGQDSDWDAVEEVMCKLQSMGRVNGNIDTLTTGQRRLRALTNMFIAQSRLRRIPPDYSGMEKYEDARQVLEQLSEDQWLLPWVAYWLGQSAFEKDDLDTASRECRDGVQARYRPG